MHACYPTAQSSFSNSLYAARHGWAMVNEQQCHQDCASLERHCPFWQSLMTSTAEVLLQLSVRHHDMVACRTEASVFGAANDGLQLGLWLEQSMWRWRLWRSHGLFEVGGRYHRRGCIWVLGCRWILQGQELLRASNDILWGEVSAFLSISSYVCRLGKVQARSNFAYNCYGEWV